MQIFLKSNMIIKFGLILPRRRGKTVFEESEYLIGNSTKNMTLRGVKLLTPTFLYFYRLRNGDISKVADLKINMKQQLKQHSNPRQMTHIIEHH